MCAARAAVPLEEICTTAAAGHPLPRKLARMAAYAGVSIAMQMALEMNLVERGLQRDLDIYTGSFESGPSLPSGAVAQSNLHYFLGCVSWFAVLLMVSAAAVVARHQCFAVAGSPALPIKVAERTSHSFIVRTARSLRDCIIRAVQGATDDYDGCVWMILWVSIASD